MTAISAKEFIHQVETVLESPVDSVNRRLQYATHLVDQRYSHKPRSEVIEELQACGFRKHKFFEELPQLQGTPVDYFGSSGAIFFVHTRSGIWKNPGDIPHDLYIALVDNELIEKDLKLERTFLQNLVSSRRPGSEGARETEELLRLLELNAPLISPGGGSSRVIRAFAGLLARPNLSLNDLTKTYSPGSAPRMFLEKVPDQEARATGGASMVEYNFAYYDYLLNSQSSFNPFGFACLISLYEEEDVENGAPVRGVRLQSRVPSGLDPLYSLDRREVQRAYPTFQHYGEFSHFETREWPSAGISTTDEDGRPMDVG